MDEDSRLYGDEGIAEYDEMIRLEIEHRKMRRAAIMEHTRKIVRCNILIVTESIVLLSLIIALIVCIK